MAGAAAATVDHKRRKITVKRQKSGKWEEPGVG